VELVEPPLAIVAAPTPPPAAPTEPVTPPSATPSSTIATPTPNEPTEDQQLLALLSDLQRFGTLSAEDVRRELAAATQALSRQRTDFNRVRLAVLYTL